MMATIRALPRVVHPGANETFHSWMTRLAARLDLDINTTLRAIGYTDDRTRARASLTGYGLTIAPSRIPAIATATRLPEHRVTDTLLTVFNGGPLTLNIDALATPEGVRIATLTQWVHAGTSTACIQCLVDSGYQWDLNWRLPWVFTCTTHRQSHTNLCPECEQPFQGGRRSDGSLGPRVAASVPLADACTNPAAGTASRGRPTITSSQ